MSAYSSHLALKRFIVFYPKESLTMADARMFCVLQKMLACRGYTEIETELRCTNVGSSILLSSGATKSDVKVVVFWCLPLLSFGKSDMLGLIKYCRDQQVKIHMILVCDNTSAAAIQLLKGLKAETNLTGEELTSKDLFMDKSEYCRVPIYELLDEKQQEQMLSKFKVTRQQLPKMLSSDAMARYFNFLPGSIVKATSKSDKRVVYRYVI